ncbi:protein lev-9-like [Argopecten irradians]|uniref:protein lev-9-like n=1 Tax=Argopecten irradians TaxID=31199 RepID=UPI00370FC5C7
MLLSVFQIFLDIDECATNTSLCSDGCDNFGGGYRCTCTPGYVLYTVNGTEGYYIPIGETGERPGDLYHLNHTCVHVTCDSPPTLQDGAILNKQTTYHYGDSLDYKCNLGFVLSDYRIINCQTNGSWSYQFPTCTVATCPPDGPEQWTNTTVPATAAFPSVLAYLDVVILTCNVSGVGIFNRTRQCLYDQPTNTYRLIGDSYECGEINCGSPADFLNGEVQNVTGITYGNSFFVRCGPLFRLHGNSSYGDEQVRCAADGYWDYGNLICLPITCPDPGKPLDGSFVGTNFSLGGTVSFSCDDSELQIVGNPHLECVLSPDNTSLLWNGTIPACKDIGEIVD